MEGEGASEARERMKRISGRCIMVSRSGGACFHYNTEKGIDLQERVRE